MPLESTCSRSDPLVATATVLTLGEYRPALLANVKAGDAAVTVFGVMTAGLFPIIHLGRPWFAYWLFPYPNQRHLWVNFRSPLLWDVFAIGTYFTISLVFWFVGLIPDFATLRDRAKSPLFQKIYAFLAMVAVALLDGQVLPDQYRPERILRHDVQSLLRKVTVRSDEACSRLFPEQHACRLRVTLNDGQVFSGEKQD